MDRLQGWAPEPDRSLPHTLFDQCDTGKRLNAKQLAAQTTQSPFAMSLKGEYMAFGATTGIEKKEVQRDFCDGNNWWNSITIQAILEVVTQMAQRKSSGVLLPREPLFWQSRFCLCNLSAAFGSMSSSRVDDKADEGCPLLSLGRNSMWQTQNTVSVVTAGTMPHFVTIAIPARIKVVLIFDSAAGKHDGPNIWAVSLLQSA